MKINNSHKSFLKAIAVFTLFSNDALGGIDTDRATAFSTQRVVHKIQISKVSDLNFGEASPGEGAKTVPPGRQENAENASFRILGEPNRSFFILLPPPNTVVMRLGSGGHRREIRVQNFQSFPSKMASLNSKGESMVYVGATRDSLPSNQKSGDYVGSFVLTVVY